jgi:hypothetical protein
MNNQSNEPEKNQHEEVSTTIPPAELSENKARPTHARSHAAHLDSGGPGPNTKAAIRPGMNPGSRKEP